MRIEQIYTGCLSQGTYYIESNGEVAIIDPLREIDTYCSEREEKLKWLKIAKKYNLKHTVNLYTLVELLPKYKVYSKNFKISNIKTYQK